MTAIVLTAMTLLVPLVLVAILVLIQENNDE